jgi:ferredoxin
LNGLYSEGIACGPCVEICPEVFKLDAIPGYTIASKPGGADQDKIQEAK